MSENLRLLLVEDNPGDVRLIQEYLKDVPMMNVELGVVDTLEEAQKVLEEDNIDLVLLDLGLPDSAGLDTVVEVISQNPSVPVVVLTGLADNRRAMEAINGGAQDYLVKDLITTDVLVRSIRYSVHRKQSRVEIEESELKYRSLWDNSANGLAYHELITDDNGKPIDSIFLDVNTSFEKITGKRREEIIGKRFSKVKDKLLPTDFDLAETFWKVALTGEPMSIEFHNQKTQRWLSVSVYSPSYGKFVCTLQDITEKKETEKDQKILAAAFEQSTDSIVIVDLPGKIQYVNPSYERITGYTTSEVIGKTPAMIRYYDDNFDDDFYKNIRDVTVRGDTWHGQVPIQRKDGSLRLLDRVIVPVLDESNVITHFVGVSRDITAEVEARKVLSDSEEKFRSVFEESAIANSLYDSSGIMIETNQAGVELVGAQSREDLLGFKLFEDPNLPDDVKKRVRSGETVRFVSEFSFDVVKKSSLYNTSKSGILFLDVLIAPFGKTEQGSALGYYVQLQDITDQIRANEVLTKSEETFRTLFEDSPLSYQSLDEDSNILHVNKKWLDTLGYSQEDVIGHSFADFLHTEDSESFRDIFSQFKKAGSISGIEFRIRHGDGSYRDGSFEGCIRYDEYGKIISTHCEFIDITEKKKADADLQFERERYISVLNTLDDGIYVVDKNYDVEYANLVIEKEFGLAAGRKCYSHLHDRKEPCPWCKFDEVFAGNSVRWEWYSEKNGRHYDLLDTPMKNADGGISKFEIFHDITNQKLAESLIIEEKQRAQSYLDIASVMIVALDENGIITIMNQRACKILRCLQEDYIGKSWFDSFIPKKLRKESSRIFTQLMRGEIGVTKSYEHVVVTHDGEERTITWNNTLLTDSDGRPIGTLSSGEDITERKLTEETIKKSEEKYRILYEKLSDALFLSNKDGQVTLYNDMAVNLFGYDEDELLGKHFTDLLHPEDCHRILNSHEKHLKTGESIIGGFDAKARRKDGSYFDVTITNTILMEEGKPSGYQSLIHDITNRKRNERQLLENEEKYRTLFESAQDGIFMLADGIFMECNAEALKMFGCTKEQILGKTPFHFSPPVQPDGRDSKEKALERIELALAGEPQIFEWLHMKNDRTHFYTNVGLNAFSFRGKVVLQAIVRDITELKRAEVELREREKLYRLLAENTFDCIWQIDLDTTFTYVNQAVFRVFGFTSEEWIGSQLYEHCSPEAMKLMSNIMLEAITQGTNATPETFEIRMLRKDGTEIDVEITANLILDDDKEPLGFQGTTRDITEHKRAEEALRESEREKSTILNTMDDLVIYYSSPDMKIEWTNQAAAKSVDMSVDELVGKFCYKIWHQRNKPLESCPVVRAFKTGRLEKSEATSPDKRSWMVVGSPVKNEEERTIGVVKVSRDITEKKRAEDALRESEERHRMVLSSMSDMIFVLDENNNYIEFYASNQFAPIAPPEVFIGKNVVEILPSKVAQKIIEIANRVRETGNREELEYSLMVDSVKVWYSSVFDMHENSDSIVQTVRNITLRRKAEDDVKERESEYRTLVSNIPGAVYHCAIDKHWTMFFLSNAIENITGYPASDFIMNQTRSFYSIIHPDDRKHVVDETTKSVEQQESYTLEYRIIGEDGMIRCIRDYGQGIPGPDKQIGYLDGILFDVTNEKLAQDEMVRLREVQQASFELSLALGETLELDKIYRIVHKHVEQVMDTAIFIVSYYDRKTKNITAGYVITDGDLVDVQNLSPISLEDEGMGTQSQVIRSGKPLYLPDLVGALEKTKTEYSIKSEGDVREGPPPDDGKQHSKSAMYIPLLLSNEVVGVMQVQSYNINAYNQEQLDILSGLANVTALAVQNAKLFDTLSESEDMYRLLAEVILDGLYIRDDFVFLYMNQQMAEMIGKDRSGLIGTKVYDWWTPDSLERIKEHVRSDSKHIIDLELLRSDGSTRIVEAFGKSCKYGGKDARIVAIRDISKQKKAQQETKQAADTALLYLDIMSHDVRNQLQAVVMASEIMQHMELDVESILALEIITESVEKSQKLINKVLSTRELLTVPLYEISLETALKNSLESLNELYEEIEIETKCSTKDPKVSADKFIEQLLLNIFENAVEYNKRKDRKLWIDIQKSGQGYQILIKDNGQGISDAKKESLFDPSRRFGGVGIHQTIRILQKYEGHISVHDRVESDPTQGTEFRLWFPKARKRS